MRVLDRDRQAVYLATYEGMEPETDSEGRYTGRHVLSHGDPEELWCSVSAAKGSAEGAVFGLDLEYDRTIISDDPTLDVSESDLLWVDADPETDQHDYRVVKVARTPNLTALAVSRVEVGA